MVKLLAQVIKFSTVGIICFFIDFTSFTILNFCGINYLIANVIAYLISMVLNYILSMKYVFERKEEINRKVEFMIFVLLSMGGLVINEISIWGCVDILGTMINRFLDINDDLIKMLGKIVATGIVMIYNFVSRKLFLEKK